MNAVELARLAQHQEIAKAPRSSYISLSRKMSQSWPQICYHLNLKSAILDKVVTRDLAGGVTCFAGTVGPAGTARCSPSQP